MPHGAPHEEAEHVSHHAHDPFDRSVAMSMVVIAAVLAAVKVLGHRTHNDTLAYQIKAGVAHTQESDQWNFFQAKKMREVLAELRAQLAVPQLTAGKSDEQLLAEIEKDLRETRDNLDKGPEAEKLGTLPAQARAALERAQTERDKLKKAVPDVTSEQLAQYFEAKVAAARYRAESRIILNHAAAKHAEAEGYRKESDKKHHQANFFDLGELGVELALVLSSVAILTKRRGYWYLGLALGVLGLVCVGAGFFVK